MSLPSDKYLAWRNNLEDMIKKGKTTISKLESTVGRLNHAPFLIPLSRHFLNGLQSKFQYRRASRQTVRLSQNDLDNLDLWRTFLGKANEGISINLLTMRNPSRVGWSDSCPFGLGGYLLSGRAWRIRVPEQSNFFGNDSVNNVLEFLGMAINIFLMLDESKTKGEEHPSILALGDNTSAISWTFCSSKITKTSAYFDGVKLIAREVARRVIQSDAQLVALSLSQTF